MAKQKLCLGVVKAGQKRITTLETIPMDLLACSQAIDLIAAVIEEIYEEYEREGIDDESYDDSEERN